MPSTTRKPARSPCATNGSPSSWPMPRSRRNSTRPATCIAALLLTGATVATADETSDPPRTDAAQLAGDYFVGASVFLFERSVLAAFASPETDDATLDAGAIVLAREKANSESGSVALQAI